MANKTPILTPEQVQAAERETWSEEQFTYYVIDFAKTRGWLVFHPRPARRKDGSYRTATQGHKGFPDLVLVRGDVIFAELKVGKGKGKPSAEQREWIERINETSVPAYLWYPKDWEEIAEVLS